LGIGPSRRERRWQNATISQEGTASKANGGSCNPLTSIKERQRGQDRCRKVLGSVKIKTKLERRAILIEEGGQKNTTKIWKGEGRRKIMGLVFWGASKDSKRTKIHYTSRRGR